MMKTQQLMVVLTIANAALLTLSLSRPRPAEAQDVTPVLRCRALQLVDDHGRIRASIAVYPADPNVKMPDGTKGYPETVLFRMITSQGRPNVKIAATEDGSVISLGGESDPTYLSMLARGSGPALKLNDKNGKTLVIKP